MGENGKNYVTRNFSRGKIAATFYKKIEELN
jgi:hypothetical protein